LRIIKSLSDIFDVTLSNFSETEQSDTSRSCPSAIPHGRSHALRHTLACRIVNQGGSIKEVADVLRHRSLDTSLIYAKLAQGTGRPCTNGLARLLMSNFS